jgi:hypothetical protein
VSEYLYDGSPEKIREVYEKVREGVKILCARCRSPLTIALDHETATKHNVHPGVYCPKDERHVMVMANLKPRT